MEWNDAIDVSKCKFTSRQIVQRSLARGWKVCGFASNAGIFLLYIPGISRPVQIFSSAPFKTSYPAAKIAQDKYITNQILAFEGLPVPAEVLIDQVGDVDTQNLQKFLEEFKQVVVKPLDSAHGKGITLNISHFAQLEAAITIASEGSRSSKVLIEQQVLGHDLRLLCIDYTFVEAISRTPASVTGDGQHNITELIILTNEKPERGENYRTTLNVIPQDKVLQFLGQEEVKRIPAEGEIVPVIGVSNVGTGGVRTNVTSKIPEFLKEIANKAALILELPVCAIDFMVKDLPLVTSSPEDVGAYIIEVNSCPSMLVYDDLGSPEQLGFIDKYLDYLAK